MRKLLYIFSIVILASCSDDDDPNPLGDSVHIYTEVLNKGQYDSEYGTENWEYMYLAWDNDKSCASSINTTSNLGDLSDLTNSVIMSVKSIKP